MEQLSNIVGKNLASLRKARGLTQQELAKEINYSDKSISKWELGYALPSVDVLKDFAEFYGVTVDYLIREQKEEELIATAQKETPWINLNHGLILAMSMTFIVLVALSVFFSEYYSPFSSSAPDPESRHWAWSIFIWMVPVCLLVAAFETRRFWRPNKIAFVVLLSCFVWFLFIAFAVYFAFFARPSENVWYILAACIPIQVIIILAANFRRKPKEKQ